MTAWETASCRRDLGRAGQDQTSTSDTKKPRGLLAPGFKRDSQRRGWDLNPRSALRRTTVFKTAAFDRSATPPRHRLRCSAERCLRGRKGPPAKRLTGVNLVRGFKSLPLRLLGAPSLKGQRALRAAHPIPWDTLTPSVNARTAADTAPHRACTAPAEEDPQPPSRCAR